MAIGPEFKKELEVLLNKYSVDAQCDIPDFILADFVADTLFDIHLTMKKRKEWLGKNPYVGFRG